MLPAGRTYQSPTVVDGGRARNSNLAWRCGKGTVAVLDNAYYCAGSNAISYDGFFLSALSKKTGQLNHSPGDFAAILALAHESGHALQYQLGIRSLFDFPNEQNADCFAGVAAYQLHRSGLLHPTDLSEAKIALTLLADKKRAGPLQDAHGDAEQRVGAFLSGYGSGAAGCLPFKPTTPTKPPWMPPNFMFQAR
jgi:predicted metalloprotease